MQTPVLTPVESKRFVAWQYVKAAAQLFVRFHATEKQKATDPNALGKLYVYNRVAPEIWDEGQEAESKGSWLTAEIIKNPGRYPYALIDESAAASAGVPAQNVPSQTAPPRTAAPATETATLADMQLVPEPVREVKEFPAVKPPTLPEILPAEEKDGAPSFKALVTERSNAIVAAIPAALRIASPEAYRALGAALVVIKSERKAVDDAFGIIARPLIDAKRALDQVRSDVIGRYESTEKRLEVALQVFKREDDERIRRKADEDRRANQARADAEAASRRKAEQDRLAEEAKRLEDEAKEKLKQANEAIEQAKAGNVSDAATVIEEAHAQISYANKSLQVAEELKTTEVAVVPAYVPPVVYEKTDLKVEGLRKKAPLWKWRFRDQALKRPHSEGETIRRNMVVKPDEIPNEYWVLDDKAISAHVKSIKDGCTIPNIEAYDANA